MQNAVKKLLGWITMQQKTILNTLPISEEEVRQCKEVSVFTTKFFINDSSGIFSTNYVHLCNMDTSSNEV